MSSAVQETWGPVDKAVTKNRKKRRCFTAFIFFPISTIDGLKNGGD